MTIRRNSSTDTLNKELNQKLVLQQQGAVTPADSAATTAAAVAAGAGTANTGYDYLLLSCRINAYSSPPQITTELVPVQPSHQQDDRHHATEEELYFLQWVFSGMFSQLNSIINAEYPDYKILRPEIEPGISWEDFRTERRALLVWIARNKPAVENPIELLVNYCQSSSSDQKAEWMKYGVFVGTMAKQIQLLKLQLQEFRKQLDATETGLDNIWEVISASYPTVPAASDLLSSSTRGSGSKNPPPTATPSPAGPSTNDGGPNDNGEWSVVEDEDDDEREELTSASLSGYEDYEDSDI